MIILDFIFTLIEDFVLCYSTFYLNKIRSKYYLFLAVVLCFIETYYFNYVSINNNLLLALMPITITFVLMLVTKKLKLTYLVLPIVIENILIMSNTLSMCAATIVFNISIMDIIPSNISIFIPTVIFSRFLLIFFSFCLIKVWEKWASYLFNKSLIAINIFLLSSVLMFNTLMSSICYSNFSIYILYEMILYLLVLCGSSIFVFYIIIQQNEENIRISEKMVSDKYRNDLYSITKKTQEMISKDIHMMKYSLMKIYNYINGKDYDGALIYLKKELNKYINYTPLQISNNPLFDLELNELIKELKRNEITLKTVVSIQENTLLFKDISIITYIIETIRCLCNNCNLREAQLFLEENEDNYKMKFITDYQYDQGIAVKSHDKLRRSILKKEEDYTEIIFLFMKEDLYEKDYSNV